MVARREWTRRWYDAAITGTDQIVTSLATIVELNHGDYPNKSDALTVFDKLPLLDIDDSVQDVVDAYLSRKIMPHFDGMESQAGGFKSEERSFDACESWNRKSVVIDLMQSTRAQGATKMDLASRTLTNRGILRLEPQPRKLRTTLF
ncbi:MAG: hypothetical protein SGI77_27455 [Pirellulaceae bacterium]|nr:hypothetical protein [Pirellulaceae bacterium]